ncbi:MAG: hypothetical protein ABIO70_06645 [Pseudomonadota bacterium]
MTHAVILALTLAFAAVAPSALSASSAETLTLCAAPAAQDARKKKWGFERE